MERVRWLKFNCRNRHLNVPNRNAYCAKLDVSYLVQPEAGSCLSEFRPIQNIVNRCTHSCFWNTGNTLFWTAFTSQLSKMYASHTNHYAFTCALYIFFVFLSYFFIPYVAIHSLIILFVPFKKTHSFSRFFFILHSIFVALFYFTFVLL
jgi:hypothetical protein